ncbi:hypothetical protein MTO96_031600 [Rhipicephalus appendiculatus]
MAVAMGEPRKMPPQACLARPTERSGSRLRAAVASCKRGRCAARGPGQIIPDPGNPDRFAPTGLLLLLLGPGGVRTCRRRR